MRGVFLSFLLSVLSGLIFPAETIAYTLAMTPKGAPVRWTGEVKINLAGNPDRKSVV